jgi:hypothetical protein
VNNQSLLETLLVETGQLEMLFLQSFLEIQFFETVIDPTHCPEMSCLGTHCSEILLLF